MIFYNFFRSNLGNILTQWGETEKTVVFSVIFPMVLQGFKVCFCLIWHILQKG